MEKRQKIATKSGQKPSKNRCQKAAKKRQKIAAKRRRRSGRKSGEKWRRKIRYTLAKFQLNLQSDRNQTGIGYSMWKEPGTNTGIGEENGAKMDSPSREDELASKTCAHACP
ncbi:hypothetical protein TURU_105153 [Turdus rufiventris]|nr:hypothetical protein TURU_105153 [Turdus rufiventris]